MFFEIFGKPIHSSLIEVTTLILQYWVKRVGETVTLQVDMCSTDLGMKLRLFFLFFLIPALPTPLFIFPRPSYLWALGPNFQCYMWGLRLRDLDPSKRNCFFLCNVSWKHFIFSPDWSVINLKQTAWVHFDPLKMTVSSRRIASAPFFFF